MTSTADTGEYTEGHPEAAEISALTEGILPADRSAALRNHLASCGLCTDVRDSLDVIRGLLGTFPGPMRIPDDVAGRIDAALAAEALIGATAPGIPAAETGGARVSRETSTRPTGHATAPTGPGRPRRRRWTRVVLATVCAAAALGVGSVYVQSLVSSNGIPHISATGTAPVPGTFSGTALATRVHELIAAAGPSNGPKGGVRPENTPMSTAGTSTHTGSSSVPPCVLNGTGRTDQPLGSTRGTYDGRAAYLLVLPHPSDPSRVDAFVVDASCASAAASAPGHVMARATYTR
ncbi:hypothetical protein NGB36_14585 [Streptomyces sp. RB6PN25]|uniref:Zinc-finger domain-containing protein n=1 Tax=Streptomyces humicola TaxID=2953240 RepID=A0ABT1PZ47_9ACTN|nr:hypothetical protein [Streptomyces humicola]MCQ4081802.1 hypothetical protein [Streptomyces humicola]